MGKVARRRLAWLACPGVVPLAVALALTAAGGAAVAERPRRIVSLNLCSDQLVLALADRDQIAGLTRNATQPDMSADAARARGLRLLDASAEELLAIRPDLVIGMPARGSAAVSAIPAANFRTLDLKAPDTLGEIFFAIRQTAMAVGHPERGEALVARMRGDLARIPRNGQGRVAAHYQRRGYMTGTGTLMDDLMTHAGLVNLAAKLDKPALSQVGLEEMVAARPDYIIVDSATDRISDQGTEMLHHPALAGIARISIPQSWTVCGGPAYVRAAKSLARQIAAGRAARGDQ